MPDLVIMDVMMPRVDGISLCKSIRENPKTRNVKVLAITAFPEQDNVKKMYDAGADLCLIKPLQLEHLGLQQQGQTPHPARVMVRSVLTNGSHPCHCSRPRRLYSGSSSHSQSVRVPSLMSALKVMPGLSASPWP